MFQYLCIFYNASCDDKLLDCGQSRKRGFDLPTNLITLTFDLNFCRSFTLAKFCDKFCFLSFFHWILWGGQDERLVSVILIYIIYLLKGEISCSNNFCLSILWFICDNCKEKLSFFNFFVGILGLIVITYLFFCLYTCVPISD